MRAVEVLPYNPAWPGLAAVEIQRIQQGCNRVFILLEHIGSTSVPGLAAKPILDLLGEVGDLTAVDNCNEVLATLGYQAKGEFGIPGRRYFFREEGSVHTHHLHIFATGDKGLTRHRAFRDYLRAHPVEAADYGALKIELARRFPTDINAYMDGKQELIQNIEGCALKWVGSIEPKKGIVLIGMAGVGKSTIGLELSKALGFEFTDLDQYIHCKDGMTVQEIIDTHGEDYLVELEAQRMYELDITHRVVAPGGSIIYHPALMAYLKHKALLVYLKSTFAVIERRLSNAPSRGIVGFKNRPLREIFNERDPLYAGYADIILDTTEKTKQQIVYEISRMYSASFKN